MNKRGWQSISCHVNQYPELLHRGHDFPGIPLHSYFLIGFLDSYILVGLLDSFFLVGFLDNYFLVGLRDRYFIVGFLDSYFLGGLRDSYFLGGFQILRAVTMKSTVSWNLILCKSTIRRKILHPPSGLKIETSKR